ncbi:MAG: GNAT family N-acetyltransferase [Pseudooceanicola sp.]
MTQQFSLEPGFPPDQRDVVAALFWQAFQGKLTALMGPEQRAREFLARVADPSHAICAVAPSGGVLGVAGFKTETGAFIGGGLGDLAAIYGWVGACWRAVPLSLIERPVTPGYLLMDGIMVDQSARGQGVGTALLSAVKAHAIAQGCNRVRLDVIEDNTRARALYERQGFVAEATSDIGPLRHVFGFRRSTRMACDV